MVPPPEKVPIDPLASELGLCDGLRVQKDNTRQWYCGCCRKAQLPNSYEVWVPDSVVRGESESSVSEKCRLNSRNGEFSAWCIKCAPKKTTSKGNCGSISALSDNEEELTSELVDAFNRGYRQRVTEESKPWWKKWFYVN